MIQKCVLEETRLNCKSDLIQFQLDVALLNAYEYMQKFAVGLEQIVWDQEDHGLLFRKEFKDAEFKLRTVSYPRDRLRYTHASFSKSIRAVRKKEKKKNRTAERDFHNRHN